MGPRYSQKLQTRKLETVGDLSSEAAATGEQEEAWLGMRCNSGAVGVPKRAQCCNRLPALATCRPLGSPGSRSLFALVKQWHGHRQCDCVDSGTHCGTLAPCHTWGQEVQWLPERPRASNDVLSCGWVLCLRCAPTCFLRLHNRPILPSLHSVLRFCARDRTGPSPDAPASVLGATGPCSRTRNASRLPARLLAARPVRLQISRGSATGPCAGLGPLPFG